MNFSFYRHWTVAVLLSLGVMTASRADDYRDASLPIADRVDSLLSQMTVKEKLGQLQQHVMDVGSEQHLDKFQPAIAAGEISSFIYMVEDPAFRNAVQRVAIEDSRLGIPLLFGADVIHGHRTIFPIPLGLACAWDPSLFERVQTVGAREAKAMGLNWTFAPMCDLARDSRWGRVAETGGEDPYLNSLYAAAAVHGFQGNNPAAPDRVISCLKHYVGYSAAVGGRDYNQTEISDFILRNFHLPAFHAGVNAGALTVMSAFNANDGIPVVASHYLLTDILRGEWGFSGFVVSDWEGVAESIDWGYSADEVSAARNCLMAGNDMEMLSQTYPKLEDEVNSGKFPMEILDEAVRRVLKVKFQAGLFEHPYVDETLYANTILMPDSLTLARTAVAHASVLLKNNGALPIASSVKKIALIGPFADETREPLGCWTSQGKAKDVVTLATALKARLNPSMQLQIVQGCDINGNQPRTKTLTDGTVVVDKSVPPPVGLFDLPAAAAAAADADVVIMALGEPWYFTGENASRARITLPGRQQELFDTIAAVGKPVIVILFCGRPLTLPAVFDNAAAVIVAWQPGVQAGPGLADLLFGDVNPSGRLTISWPVDVGQLPMYYNRYTTGRPGKDFIDYRDMSREPLFPFGFGLSYTKFDYGKMELTPGSADHPARVEANIKNNGDRKGDEVVQLYIRQVACPEGARPSQELRGFQHVVLKPGEDRDVSFDLTDEVLGYVGRDGKWRCDPGDYEIWVSPHAHAGDPVRYTRPAPEVKAAPTATPKS